MGWSALSNGELLLAAEVEFDLLVTTDQNLRYQQNLGARRIAILILSTTSWPRIQRHIAFIVKAAEAMKHGEYSELDIPH
jgi:hypothetical protein